MYFDKKISKTVRECKRFDCSLELKSFDGQGRFAGYASVFNLVDNQRDIMVRGAFRQTLKDRVQEVKLLWQHQQDEPIGLFERMFEDGRGLYVEGRLLLNLQRGKEAYTLLKEGIISGLSIGYSPVRYDTDPSSGARRLLEVDLWEISLVTFPANSAALVTVIKSDEWESAVQCGHAVALSQALDRAFSALEAHFELV